MSQLLDFCDSVDGHRQFSAHGVRDCSWWWQRSQISVVYTIFIFEAFEWR